MTIVCVIKSLKLLADDIAALHRKAFSSWKIDCNVSNKSLQLRLEDDDAVQRVIWNQKMRKNYWGISASLKNANITFLTDFDAPT